MVMMPKEDTHPHILLYGTLEQCSIFLSLFETISIRHIVRTRGSLDGVSLNCELYPVETEDYLMNVAAYVIIQPTKDGKPVMYYDYKWGTGSMYFRTPDHMPIWLSDEKGSISIPKRYGDMTYREKNVVSGKHIVPDDWLTANGLILPDNYINPASFERIYRTHNCFRTFAGAGRKQLSTIDDRMVEIRGVMMDDIEAGRICTEEAGLLFGTKDIRRMDLRNRYLLAKSLRQKYTITHRQLAALTRIPESELRKYIR